MSPHPARRVLLAAVLGFAIAPPAGALVAGGGSKKSDCYVEWQVTTPEQTANRGRVGVDCQDGDPACDVDGAMDGTCTIGVSVCVFQSEPGCTPQEVTAITPSKKTAALGLEPPPVPATAAACGPAAIVTLPLKQTRKGAKPSKKITLKMTATSSGKPRKDKDTLVLRCVPNRGAGACPANAAGGPSELTVAVAREGTDLDNGWTGISHNFPVVYGSTLRACLQGCDASGTPACTSDQAATDAVNGATFGAPLPLFAANIPVCVVNRFATPKITDVSADVLTGATSSTIHLLSDIYLTSAVQLCPRCSGSDLGKPGTCDSGARQGQACRTEGIVTVGGVPQGQNPTYTLSSDCPPVPGARQGTIPINLPATTGTSTLAGPRPCGAAQDDGCGAGVCNAPCQGPACATMLGGQCVDAKGGVSQLCCSSNQTIPCFPTRTGAIERTGSAAPPTPAGTTYPKTETATLVATFCEASSGSNVVDVSTGLPGPGAIILPSTLEWTR
jgi:hypothetical protein